jgi:glyoxylase-like metal-dependent hydrolase (beta-lactamase superfamily II)
MFFYKKFCFGNGFSNTYVVWDEGSRGAIIVDCGNEAAPIFDFMEQKGLFVKHIFLTHAHYDHVLYMDQYRSLFPDANIYIGRADAPLLSDPEGNVSYLFRDTRAFSMPDRYLNDGDIIALGEREIRVICTPGHTPGGICLYAEEDRFILTGDTIFAGGGIGRTDFKYGDFSEIRKSLERILSMDGEITILPGHGGESKIKYEQRSLFY